MAKHAKQADAEQGDKRYRIWRWLKIAALVLAIVVLLGVVGALAVFAYVSNSIKPSNQDMDKARKAVTQVKPLAPQNILLLGSDSRGEKHARSDTIIIAHVDTVNKRATLVSIPRDARVDIPGFGMDKVNAAMSLGGPALTIKTVRQYTGIPIHHYVEVDFDGFVQLINAIGGVWIDVEKRIDDPKAGSVVLEPGYQHLSGKAALTYVRTRKDAQGDYGRIKRQQKFFGALLDQSRRVQTVFAIPQLVNIFAKNTETDMSLGDLAAVAYYMKSIQRKNMEGVTIPMEDEMINGVWYGITKEKEKRAICARVIRNLPVTQSIGSTETTGIARPRPRPKPILAKDVTVEIKNGGGPIGAAGELGRKLNGLGFVVTGVGNAQRRDYTETQVIYRSSRAKAAKVEQAIGTGAIVAGAGRYNVASDVLVILGEDFGRD